jgi:type II secretory pathway pseudopilin PulG
MMGCTRFKIDRTRGFTIVEAIISLIIVATMFVAALNTVGTSRLSQYKSSLGSRGRLLAESLMTEILRRNYQDPDGQSVFGREPGESASTRADFDDVDDYHGWSSSPPVEKDGTLIPGLTGWKRSVTVEWVDPLDVTQVRTTETNVKRVTVTVSYDDVPVISLVGIKSYYGL